MKRIFKYLLLSLIVLVPFSASAIKTENVKLDETRDGYYCYLLANDSEGQNSYDPIYSNRLYAGFSTKKPTPRCFDSIYSSKEEYLADKNCFFDYYKTLIALEDNKYVYHSYSNWNSSISETNRSISNMQDCIAASIITSSTGGGKKHNQILFVETRSNSEIYSDDEMKTIKENIYSDFDDSTEFCYAATMYRQDAQYPLAVYFGHPKFIVDYRGVGDKDDSTANALVREFDKDKKAIINFSGVEITTSPSRRGDAEENKIVIDGFPHADDSTTTFDELDKLASQGPSNYAFFVVDGDNKLITDSETCIGLAAEKGLESTVVDETKEDEDREIGTDDFDTLVSNGMTKEKAFKACYNGDSSDGKYHCYRYTYLPIGGRNLMYNTTVWTNKKLNCGFELVEDWDWTQCKKSALDVTYKQCKSTTPLSADEEPQEYCRNITHSGYNGTPDFYDLRDSKDKDIECNNLNGLHIIYRAATIIAPIIAILFITFDLVSSIMSGDPKKVAKFRTKLFRRIISLVLFIVIPIFIHILVNTLSKNSYLKDTKYLKCIVIGNGSDIHEDTDKTTSSTKTTTTTTKTTTSDTKATTVVKTTGETTIKKSSPDLIKNVTVDGQSIDYNSDQDIYNLVTTSDITEVTIDADVVTDDVEIISGAGPNEITDGENTINIVATTGDGQYDVTTIVINNNIDDEFDLGDLDDDLDLGDVDDDLIEGADDSDGDDEEEEEEPEFEIVTDTVKVQLTDAEIKANKNKFLNSAKKLKTLTSKKNSKTFWCAKRVTCLKRNKKGKCTKEKIKNPACTTKAVEKLYGNKQKFGSHVGGYSCASLVSYSLYDSGLYTAYEVNHVANSSATRNINSANSMAKFLIAKGWKVITKAKDLQAGDVIFEDKSGKPAVKVGGKTHHPGHVEIYAGNGKSYNTGGTAVQHVLKSNYNTGGFGFALRYVGK
ncbi:MAG: hypothetical protein IKP98_02125 [Bacilli bacterium]|nr:hypothetical protein [Bacilli bacterium]